MSAELDVEKLLQTLKEMEQAKFDNPEKTVYTQKEILAQVRQLLCSGGWIDGLSNDSYLTALLYDNSLPVMNVLFEGGY